MKPYILISGEKEPDPDYIYAIEAAGAICDYIHCPNNIDINVYDAFILSGGEEDVSPIRYGKQLTYATSISDERDECEFRLYNDFKKAGKPILGICRGMQLINVAQGGTLYQDLPIEHNTSHFSGDYENDMIHPSIASKSGFIGKIFKDRFNINSIHHQGICDLGKDLVIEQYAVEDGLPEAIRHTGYKIFAVQWHPERMCQKRLRTDTPDSLPLFQAFVALSSHSGILI